MLVAGFDRRHSGSHRRVFASVFPAVDDSPALERIKVHYGGRVQGVGFRETTRRIAGRHRVCGYVRNLHDGRVELVAEGERAELERLVAEIGSYMERFILGAETRWGSATGEFDGFAVRF